MQFRGVINMSIEFRAIPGFNDYMASSDGKIRCKNGKRDLTPWINKTGYMTVSLKTKNGKFKRVYVHRLVAQAFIPNPNNYPEVNHKDENKLNNSILNLEWCDKKYNRNYGTRNIRAANSRSKNVTCLSKDLTNVKTYRNIIDASNDTGICRQELYTICQGKKAATGKFYWWYTDEFIILLLKLCTSKTKKAIFHSPVVELLSYQQLYELMLRLINQDDGDLMCPVKK